MDSSGYVGRGPVEGLRARARKLGRIRRREPLLACDLDEKDEAGRAEADEVGEEAGVHEHDPGHEHHDPLGGRGFGEQPSLHTGGEADDAEHGGEHGLQDGGPVAHEQERGLEDEDEGDDEGGDASLEGGEAVFMGGASAMAAPA